MGDGGALLTGDAEIADRARALRDYGQRSRYEHAEPGLNSRLDELHAALLRSAFLPRLDRALSRRGEIAARYGDALAGGPLRPIRQRAGASAHHLFPIEVLEGEPAAVAAALQQRGISVGRHYPFVCPDQAAAAGAGIAADELAVARRLAARELSLPIHPYLSDEEVGAVIDACREVCA